MYSFYGLTIQFLLCGMLLAAGNTSAQKAASVKEVNVSIDFTGDNLLTVFQKIEKLSDYNFVFDKKDLDKRVRLDGNYKNDALYNVLLDISRKSGLTFKQVNKNINVQKMADRFSFEKEDEPIEILADVDISGKVTDENGQGLPGASILIKGTTKGTTTDLEGNYKLTVSDQAMIVISYIGYVPQEFSVYGRSVIDAQLIADVDVLEEIVVVGYGEQKKVNLTGAVEAVEPATLRSRPLTNTSAALQGQVAGAFISQDSGQPGNDNATILIRGVSTFGNNAPLVIVDGMIADLKDVNPRDLESVSILKDAASAAIYGNRAANGVILITTKKGKAGEMKVSYTANYGVQNTTQMPELLKGVEYLELQAQAHANSNGGVYPTWYNDDFMDRYRNNVDPLRYPTDYDWVSAVFSPANIFDQHINISGGEKAFQYSASLGYLDQEGIVEGNSTKKLTFRTNFSSFFLNDKLRFDLNLSGYDQSTEDMVNGMNNAMYFVYVAPSTTRLYTPGVGYSGQGYNWAADALGGYRNTDNSPLNVRFAMNYEIFKGLEFNTSYNVYRTDQEFEIWAPSVTFHSILEDGTIQESTPTVSRLEYTRDGSITKLYNAKLHYSKDLSDNVKIGLMAGLESREYLYERRFSSRTGFSMNLPNFSIGDPSTQKNDASAHDGAWMSYFSRANLTVKDRYLLEVTVRRDASSRFLDKWGTFPSASLGWRISEEAFIGNTELISNLKLRASWGKLGNEGIGQFYAASDKLSLNIATNFNNSLYPAGAVTLLANKATTWETSEQLNFGLDFGFFGNRFSGTMDYFVKTNSNILMQLPLSSTLGLSTLPYQNAAEMQNKGFELTLGYQGNVNELKYIVKVLASRTTNKVTNLAGQDPIIRGNLMWTEGEAFNSFFGYETEGIYQSESEINNHLRFQDENGVDINPYVGLMPVPGDIRLKDRNNDGIINVDDKTILGKPYPDWLFSSNMDLNWKNWDLGLFFQGVFGVNSLNSGFVTSPFHGGAGGTGAWYRDGWTAEKPSNTIQRVHSDPGRFEIISDYFMENASYLRLKNISLGYTIPTSILSKLGLTDVRVYGNVQNAFTLTSMRYGFDPEKPSTTTNTLQYPQTRIYTLGLNLKF